MVDLSICIVNWNTREHLRNCLNSIYGRAWRPAVEVIVVDNASSDGSALMVREAFPDVTLIESAENLGFARANNRAFGVAHGRYLFLLNPDTLLLPGSLDVLVAFADARPDAGVIGPRLLHPDGSVQWSCWRGYPSLGTALADALYLRRLYPGPAWARHAGVGGPMRAQVVDHVLGAAMLVPAEIHRRVGGMDEGTFLFYEETEWCHRIQRHGWTVYHVPEARIVHIGQQSVNLDPERTLPEFYRSFVRFYRAHRSRSRWRVVALKGIIGAACVIRVGLWSWRGRAAHRRHHAGRMRRGYCRVVRQLRSL